MCSRYPGSAVERQAGTDLHGPRTSGKIISNTQRKRKKNNKTVFRITNPKMKLLSGSNGSLKISIMNVPNEKKKEEISPPPKIKLLGHRRYLLCL